VGILSGNTGLMDPHLASKLFNMKFGLPQEREADEQGLLRLKEAQIDPSGLQ
jgi:hypothetical protein